MNTSDILRRRLANQQISQHAFTKPEEVAGWLGAVQAQDYASAKWALGLRLPGATDAIIEKAFNEGAILRTHVLRPTWHFVAPSDIRWMLELTAKHVKAEMSYYSKRAGLDDEILQRSQAILSKALKGGKYLSRSEMMALFKTAGISVNNRMLLHILGHAELGAVICSGPRQGKQFTWALFNERVPQSRVLEREEAVVELTRRYFKSHGPATVRDFAWWSGLSTVDIKAGLKTCKPQISSEAVEGKTYWYYPSAQAPLKIRGDAYLLPPFDEYMVGYTDRKNLSDPSQSEMLEGNALSLLSPTIVTRGKIVGTWKRPLIGKSLSIEVKLLGTLTTTQTNYVKIQAERYGKFLGLPVKLVLK